MRRRGSEHLGAGLDCANRPVSKGRGNAAAGIMQFRAPGILGCIERCGRCCLSSAMARPPAAATAPAASTRKSAPCIGIQVSSAHCIFFYNPVLYLLPSPQYTVPANPALYLLKKAFEENLSHPACLTCSAWRKSEAAQCKNESTLKNSGMRVGGIPPRRPPPPRRAMVGAAGGSGSLSSSESGGLLKGEGEGMEASGEVGGGMERSDAVSSYGLSILRGLRVRRAGRRLLGLSVGSAGGMGGLSLSLLLPPSSCFL